MWCLILGGLLTACEKLEIDGDSAGHGNSASASGFNVVVSVTDVDAGWSNAASRTMVKISDVCTRLCFAVYQNGTRVKNENQKAGDVNFGTYAMNLDTGSYQILVLGHSAAANPATTNPAKVQFSNPSSSGGTGFTDTFYYYGTLEVGSEGTQLNISMKRATAMFRLKTNDEKPANVVKFQFYYEGGSGTLDATTGFGCVNSKQSVFVDTPGSGQLQFEMYTFPHEEIDAVTFTVKAFDASEKVLYSKEFTDVKIQRNCITQYSGNFFTNGGTVVPDAPKDPDPVEPFSTVVMVDPEWSETFEYTY